jgi:PAS domain S-box-containing protein
MQEPSDDLISRHLARVVESSDDAIISKDLNGIITSWNGAAERMFGYAASETIGQSIRMIIPADRQAEEDVVLGRIRAGQSVTHFETIRQRKDGVLIPISVTVSPIRDDAGRVIGASKIARDISDRMQAAVANRRLASVVESSDDAIITKNLNSIVTSWNPAAERMFGYTADEAIGRSIRMLIPEELQDEEDVVLAKIRAGEKLDHFETICQHKDGTRLTISLTVSRIRNERGEIVMMKLNLLSGLKKLTASTTFRPDNDPITLSAIKDGAAARRSPSRW